MTHKLPPQPRIQLSHRHRLSSLARHRIIAYHLSALCRVALKTGYVHQKQQAAREIHVQYTCSDEDTYIFDHHYHLTAGLFPPPQAHHISSATKNWHVKAQKRKGRLGPTLPAENGNLFLAKSRLPPCHSTRFLSFEVLTRFGLIITSALLSSRWCTILLEATIVQVPASILGALLANYETRRFHHHSIIFPRRFYVTGQRLDIRHHFLVPRSWTCLSRW